MLLPSTSFDGARKHTPSNSTDQAVFLKGVDTSVSTNRIIDLLHSRNIVVSSARRLLNRISGRPTKIVKLVCDRDNVNDLLKCSIVIDRVKCTVELERRFKVIRCYNCQRFGHLARNCKNSPVCCFCSGSHVSPASCPNETKCANCSGPHPSFSSVCPDFNKQYEILAKQHSVNKHVNGAPQTCTREIQS